MKFKNSFLSKLLKKGIAYGEEEYLRHSRTILQTSILFLSELIIIPIYLATKSIQARGLGPEGYGIFAFFMSLTGFTVLFFSLGFFYSLQNILSNNPDEKIEKEYFAVGILITLFLGFIYSISLFAASIFIDQIFEIEFAKILRMMAPFCLILPFPYLIQSLAIGSNKISIKAWQNIVSKAIYLLPLSLLYFYKRIDVLNVIFLYLAAIIFTTVILVCKLKPTFKNLSERFQEIWTKNKNFGFYIYSGAVFNQTTYKLDGLLIVYFINPVQLGFYSLAGLICSPMVHFSRSLSQSLYKRFASQKKISHKVFIYNSLFLLFCIGFLFVFARLIVDFLFGPEYSQVAKYTVLISFAYFFQGMYQPFSFLSAKSKGKEIRNVALFEAIINILGNLILIPMFGVIGAIIASIAARFGHFLGLWRYYRIYLNETDHSNA